jgi:hypothetical protein
MCHYIIKPVIYNQNHSVKKLWAAQVIQFHYGHVLKYWKLKCKHIKWVKYSLGEQLALLDLLKMYLFLNNVIKISGVYIDGRD